MGEGMLLQNLSAEGGMLLQNSGGRGPYLLRTDNPPLRDPIWQADLAHLPVPARFTSRCDAPGTDTALAT